MSSCQSSCTEVTRTHALESSSKLLFRGSSPNARGHTGEAAEPGTEAAQTLESHGKTDFRHGQFGALQKELRPFDPAGGKIFVRRHLKDGLEAAQKVKRRQAGGAGDPGKR